MAIKHSFRKYYTVSLLLYIYLFLCHLEIQNAADVRAGLEKSGLDHKKIKLSIVGLI